MKQFYEHIRVDAEALSFSAECAICGRKQYAVKLPLGCRNVRTLSGCVSGKANKISQTAFNHAKANATNSLHYALTNAGIVTAGCVTIAMTVRIRSELVGIVQKKMKI